MEMTSVKVWVGII